MATVPGIVARTAEWCELTVCPLLTGQSVDCVAVIAKATCPLPTVDTRTVQQFHTAKAQHLHRYTGHMLAGTDDCSTVTGDWNNWRFTWLGACSKRKRITDANCWQLEPKWLRKEGVGEGLLPLLTAIACCCLGTGWEAKNRIACFARAVAFAKGPLLLLHACQVPIHGTRQAHNAILLPSSLAAPPG